MGLGLQGSPTQRAVGRSHYALGGLAQSLSRTLEFIPGSLVGACGPFWKTIGLMCASVVERARRLGKLKGARSMANGSFEEA